MAFYDALWNKQNFVYSYPLDSKAVSKPDNLDEMIALAEKLSRGFAHVRVDFYRLDDGKLYFGEMTFSSASGFCHWSDENINRRLGEWITLPQKAYDIDSKRLYSLEKKKEKKTFFQYIRIPSEKLFLAGPIVVYHQTIRGNKNV